MDSVETELSRDADRITTATEVAFLSLTNRAEKSGLKLKPCMGLMFLPSQEVTQQFREACKAVLDSLKVQP